MYVDVNAVIAIIVAIITTTHTIKKISNPVFVADSNISIPPFNYIIYKLYANHKNI